MAFTYGKVFRTEGWKIEADDGAKFYFFSINNQKCCCGIREIKHWMCCDSKIINLLRFFFIITVSSDISV